MGSKCYDIILAGEVITGEFQYDGTAEKFGEFCTGVSEKQSGVRVPEYELDIWKSFGNAPGPQFEYSCFTAVASRELSYNNRFIIHAAAFRWNDKAYLITAPSGGGKSTFLQSLREKYPEEISVICGDRPVLWKKENGILWVYPSPWNGKENWFGAKEAPLGGLVILKRNTDKNAVKLLSKKEAAVNVFCAMIQTKETAEEIHRFASYASDIISSVPVWRLDSIEARDTAGLFHRTLMESEEQNEV